MLIWDRYSLFQSINLHQNVIGWQRVSHHFPPIKFRGPMVSQHFWVSWLSKQRFQLSIWARIRTYLCSSAFEIIIHRFGLFHYFGSLNRLNTDIWKGLGKTRLFTIQRYSAWSRRNDDCLCSCLQVIRISHLVLSVTVDWFLYLRDDPLEIQWLVSSYSHVGSHLEQWHWQIGSTAKWENTTS